MPRDTSAGTAAAVAMTERGAWCTEQIYCQECQKGFERFLVKTGADRLRLSKYWSGRQVVPGLFVGRISGMYTGEEMDMWEGNLLEKLSAELCKEHHVRVAVLPDSDDAKILIAKGGQDV